MDDLTGSFWGLATAQLQHISQAILIPIFLQNYREDPATDTGQLTFDSQRSIVAAYFAMAAAARLPAISVLMESRCYSEVMPLVRCAFEDWVNLGYILSGEDDVRARSYMADVQRDDLRAYEAFKELAGEARAAEYFADMPMFEDEGLPPWRSTKLPARAEAIHLGGVYAWAYSHMSAIVHGAYRRHIEVNQMGKRPQEALVKWEVWAWWFHLRILMLTANELGEHKFDDAGAEALPILGTDHGTLITCVMEKEILHQESSTS